MGSSQNQQPSASTPAAPDATGIEQMTLAAQAIQTLAESLKPAREPAHLTLHRTPWNPTGRRDRTKLRRFTMQNGAQVHEYTSSDEEIALWNKLRPGRFGPGRKYVVVRRPNDGAIDFRYTNKTPEDRMAVAYDHKGRGLAGLLEMCITEAEDRRANPKKYANEDLAAEDQ